MVRRPMRAIERSGSSVPPRPPPTADDPDDKFPPPPPFVCTRVTRRVFVAANFHGNPNSSPFIADRKTFSFLFPVSTVFRGYVRTLLSIRHANMAGVCAEFSTSATKLENFFAAVQTDARAPRRRYRPNRTHRFAQT